MQLRYYQADANKSIWDYFESGKTGNPVLAMPTGCHAKGQQVIMFNGSIKKVEDVEVGDNLMGPDSQGRTVLNLCRGRQEMRKIVPGKGDPFTVNKDHVLALYKTPESKKRDPNPTYKNMPVGEYETTSKWFQHIHKQYRAPVNFAHKEVPLDPYFLGLILGDGSMGYSNVSLCTMDTEIRDFATNYVAKRFDMPTPRMSHNGSRANSYHFSAKGVYTRRNKNPLNSVMRELNLMYTKCHTKFIPRDYLTTDRISRLALLAGLMDTDGHLHKKGISMEYSTVSAQLNDDFLFLCRSLGFAAYSRFIADRGTAGAYRITLSGDLDLIPCLLPRKQAPPRQQIKNVLVTGFKVEQLPEADFFGFELSGDHLYLLDDFTVTHNTGKSVCIGSFIQEVMTQYPGQKIMMLTHVKELIEQNFEKLLLLWPSAPAGIYSAGIGRKDTHCKITFGGIQSVAKRAAEFGHQDLILIDECHLVSPKATTSYRAFIGALLEINPYLKVIGYSATPYRLGLGRITDGGLFDDICYDITGMDAFNKLISEGFIAPLVPRRTASELNTDDVHTSGGDFVKKALQAACDREEVTYAALQEVLEQGHDRHHWLIFATGVEHSENIAAMLESLGVSCQAVHSNLKKEERVKRLADFKSGKTRALVNNNVLTTGFDFPGIDLIIMLRPTNSPGLWVQMLGRGTRPMYEPGFDLTTIEGRLEAMAASQKQNCLVLDFAGNTKRLGPVNDPVLPKAKGKGGGPAPVRCCEECNTYMHASARKCTECGYVFPIGVKFGFQAGTKALIATSDPVVECFNVDKVIYAVHKKEARPDSIKVSYYCGLRRFTAFVCLDHPGFAGKRGRDWWRTHDAAGKGVPPTTAVGYQQADGLAVPARIRVWVNKKFPEIMGYEFDEPGTVSMKSGNLAGFEF